MREDAEQSVKLDETVELLLAAGYFRARIKGLSPFDKARKEHGTALAATTPLLAHTHPPPSQVVGGMTWCITSANEDVDVDLLFQENSTIGQKMCVSSFGGVV